MGLRCETNDSGVVTGSWEVSRDRRITKMEDVVGVFWVGIGEITVDFIFARGEIGVIGKEVKGKAGRGIYGRISELKTWRG